jgi:baculoviral IAP repeat-containing protein 7/8
MDSEEARYLTFNNSWRVPYLNPTDLARNGFYYTGKHNIVRCYICKVEIGSWVEGDDIKKEHSRWSNSCPLTTNNSLYPQFYSLKSRLASFVEWPLQISQKPEIMSRAGFFYTGRGDRTICFYCGLKICDWEIDDDPFYQHRKFRQKCFFSEENTTSENQPSNLNDDYRLLCKICFENESNIIFFPCKHLVCCQNCAKELSNCAICRCHILLSSICYRS